MLKQRWICKVKPFPSKEPQIVNTANFPKTKSTKSHQESQLESFYNLIEQYITIKHSLQINREDENVLKFIFGTFLYLFLLLLLLLLLSLL